MNLALQGAAGRGEPKRPGPGAAAAELFALDPFWTPYARIKHSVTTGEPAFDTIYGTSVYKYFAEHPEQAALFGATAGSFHAAGIAAIVAAHDFARYPTVADIGGGTGSLLATILRANPGVRGVLFDQADVIEQARMVDTFTGLADRVEYVAGDFFESVPGADALVIAGGADRDEREYTALLTAGGFDVHQIVECGDRFSLIEARPSA